MGKILIIDDDRNVLNLLDQLLNVHGYRVIVASNGIEGIELLNSEDGVGLVITDIRMPGANGNQVAKYLSLLLNEYFRNHLRFIRFSRTF